MSGTAPAVSVRASEAWVEKDLRKLAAAACAGLVAGFAVNAVGGRLAMMLLARLNPDATGLVSDDGFVIGRFDLGATMNLVLFATALGVLGGLAFLAVRQLRVGPPWFRTASMTLGPGVVIGAALVHTGGVDFAVLHPVGGAIALFVALPALFAYVVGRLSDAWLDDGSWFQTGSRWRLVSLAPLVLLIPAIPLVVPGLMARVVYQTWPRLQTAGAQRMLRGVARAGLSAVFAVAVVDLVRDTLSLL